MLKIIKIQDKTSKVLQAIEILKNREIAFDELDELLQKVEGTRKMKKLVIIREDYSGEFQKELDKVIEKQFKKGRDLISIRYSAEDGLSALLVFE